MNKKIVTFFALLLLSFLPLSHAAASDTEALNGFDEFVGAALAPWDTPGAAIAIVRGGEVIYARGFGLRDVGRKLPVTPDTLFAIGSCSKAFTTFVMGTLVDEGKLDWNTPVRNYLPQFALYDNAATLGLTPVDLVTHRSGLPRHDLLWYSVSSLSRAEMVARLRYLEPTAALREKFQYNNLMFLTAGYLIETLTGESWERAVRRRILEPLQMSRSNFSVNDSQKDADFAKPYRKDKNAVLEIPFRNIDTIGPAGSINSSVKEMTRWLIANLQQGKHGDKQLIQQATLRQIHTPQMAIAALPTEKEQAPSSYAMGWTVSNPRGHLMLQHGGGIDGFTALISLFPLEDVGIIVLSNAGNTGLPGIVTLHAADRLLGDSRRDWNAEALARRKQGEAAAREAEQKKAAYRKSGTKPSHALADYAGEYEHAGYGLVRIEQSGDQLRAAYNTLAVPLGHWHYDVFTGLDSKDPTFKDAKFQFRLDADGDVTSLVAPFEPSVQPIVFARRPPAHSLDPAHLDKLVGVYSMPPQTFQVTRNGNTLFVNMGGPRGTSMQLVPKPADWFEVKDMPGFRVRFEPGKGGAMSLIANRPDGVFTAIRK